MTATQSVQLFQILQEHFGHNENAAKAVSAIESIINEKVDTGNKHYEELLHKDLEIVRAEMAKKDDLSALRSSMEQRFSDQMKWIIGMFIPLYLSIIGLFVTILLKH